MVPTPSWKTMVPVVTLLLEPKSDPAGSEPRAGRPASCTGASAFSTATGWVGVMMPTVGVRARKPCACVNCGWPKASSVGGSSGLTPRPGPMSPAGTEKSPPELVGGPAAGSVWAIWMRSTRVFCATTASPMARCGGCAAPSTMIRIEPSGRWTTRFLPSTVMSRSSTPAGRLTVSLGVAWMRTTCALASAGPRRGAWTPWSRSATAVAAASVLPTGAWRWLDAEALRTCLEEAMTNAHP